MVTKSPIDSAMKQWAKEELAKLLPSTRKLISLATYDLYYGPEPENDGSDDNDDWKDYPGFSEACHRIKTALEDIGELWVETWSDCVMTSEPQGEWIENPDYDPDDEDCEEEPKIWQEPEWSEIYHVERKEALGYLVDKELASYIL